MTVNIPTGNAQVTLTYSGPTVSGQAATVLGFGLGEEGTLPGLVNAVEAAFIAHLSDYQHVAFTLVNIRAIDNTNVYEKAVTIGGNVTGDLAPPNTSVLIKKTSDLRGRAFRGRNYWPGFLLDSNIYDDGTINPAWLEVLQDQFNLFGEELIGIGYFPRILHNDAVLDPTPVTGGGVENRVATQRRRLR